MTSMKGKKPIKQSSISALSKSYRKKKKSQSVLLKELSTQYVKAVDMYEDMRKQGYQFNKTFTRMMSYGAFSKKAKHVTQKDIEYYKQFTKKTNLYKRAKGFYDIDNNRMLTVSQAKIYLRRQKAKEKARKQVVSNKNKELFEKLNQINSKYFDIESQKNEVMNNYSEFVANGGIASSSLIAKIDEKIAVILYDSKQTNVNDAFDSINSMLTNGESYSDGGSIDLVGTPYETV